MCGRTLFRGVWTLMVIALLIAASAAPAAAQGGTGTIEGVAKDSQGGVLPGVTVTLRNQATGVARTTVTEADGKFRFPALNPGRFTITAELSGFTTVEVTDIEMTIGLGLTQDFTMQLQSVSETITVTGIAPVVDTTKSEVSGVVTQQQIEMLPINSRQYLSLALLMPGTSMDSTRRVLRHRQRRRLGDVQLHRQPRRRRHQQLRRGRRAAPEPARRCGRGIQSQQRAIQGRVRAGDRRHRAGGDQVGHQHPARHARSSTSATSR